MAKFRIIKKESFGNHITYSIQVRFLYFFWLSYGTTTMYNAYSDWSARNSPRHMAFLIKRRIIFSSEEKAREHLHKIKNPFKEYYKGNKIIKVLNERSWEDVFINKSFYGFKFDKFGYEHSSSIEEIKAAIDKRTFKVKKTELI